ncbi:MAG TPA: PDZ domain-containing protein [Woeseiaceae bacterium]|nr:PDZ domain-containing protein [Woeseiaceae bacterium]
MPRLDTRAWQCALLLLCWSPAVLAVDADDTLLLAEPDISREHIAFVYDGDVWVAGRDGSASRRLTTAEGIESRPHFSPDGQAIVFSGNYDGNVDVYVVPIGGGAPRRLTWHGGEDIAEDYAGPGRVLFSSQRDVHSLRGVHLFGIDVDGAFPERLPIPLGNDADVAPDGSVIAYSVMPPMMFQALMQWKGYRGGSASHIVLMDLEDHTVRDVPQPPERSNDINPMWVGGSLYFNSDRAGEFNLFRFDPQTERSEQLTSYDDFPVVNANAGAGAIIFEQAGRLHVFDPATSEVTTLHVATNSDLRETRPRWVSDPEYVRAVSPSPDLARVALEYRGEIVTVPAGNEKGAYENLTESPGANDRSPAWSPSGEQVAWFSDRTGEYRLCIASADGHGETRCLAVDGGHGFYEDLRWSPDEQYVSFLDNAYSLFVMELASGEAQVIAENRFFGHSPFISHRWSPDSRWLAYTQNTNGLIQTVHLWSVADGKSHAITNGLTEVSEPVFDPNGQYLYVLASDEAGPIKDWFALSSLDMTFTHGLYAIVLDADAPSPLPPDAAAPPAEEPAAEGGAKEQGEPPRVTVDFDGIRERIVNLPTEPATLRNLQVGKSGELYYLASPAVPAIKALNSAATLKRFALAEGAEETVLEEIDDYRVARDGGKLLFRQGGAWKWAEATAKVDAGSATPLPVETVSVYIDPRREWRQIAREAWRLNRDFFYDPGYHGVDWGAVWEKYEPFLAHTATRADVGRIISAMLSELRVGHSFTTPGETIDEPPEVGVGLLGADFEIADGRYRFAKIYGGTLNWRPALNAPLTVPGESVAQGEYLIAVHGEPLTARDNVYSRFDNTVGKPVEITVAPHADGRDARTVTVVPIAMDHELRYVDWVEGNIRKVDAATGGRVAYVHVPDTSVLGHAAFKRYFFPQSHKDALILDDRNNGGGFVADYYIDILRREPVVRWATRYGDDLVTPRAAIHGPKVMIIDEGAGSGGDLLPWMFRKLDLGTLVGTRTWGGLVGNLEIHRLMDGSTTTAPNIAGWAPEAGWIVENVGVAPDIEVEDSPQAMLAGRDPQLEKAIEVALQALEKQPPRQVERPPYPDRIP